MLYKVFEGSVYWLLYVNFVIRHRMLYHRFQTFFHPSSPGEGIVWVSRLLGGLVLGDLVTLAGV